MNRNLRAWTVFALCAAVALAAMAWLTHKALEFEASRDQWQRVAAEGEATRLSLWRMDSLAVALLAEENARPHDAFPGSSPSETRRRMQRFNTVNGHGQRLVTAYFTIAPDGTIAAATPEGETIDAPLILRTLDRAALPDVLRPPDAQAVAGDMASGRTQEGTALAAQNEAEQVEENVYTYGGKGTPVPQQAAKSQVEYSKRAWNVAQSNTAQVNAYAVTQNAGDRRVGPMVAWTGGGELLLVREVSNGDGMWLQGCRVDWPALRARLLAEVTDLLPEAELHLTAPDGVPLQRVAAQGAGSGGAAADGAAALRAASMGNVLASLPAWMQPNQPAGALKLPAAGVGARPWLVAAWGFAVLAVAAVAVLLRGSLALSERRATFVSAVTHELRTPLTTFRLYTEMLADGRVREEAARRAYLETLRGEAERLSHLVENVLAHARLERGRTRSPIEPMKLGTIVERTRERLARRAERSGMTLVVEGRDEAMERWVSVDVVSVEQILMNLVDNACKYAGESADAAGAADSADRRIHLEADDFGGVIFLRVSDHGPGLDAAQRKRLFRPFSKSAADAAGSAPGIGLGLALSRRLARAMGGDLALDERDDREGAAFVLTLEPARRI